MESIVWRFFPEESEISSYCVGDIRRRACLVYWCPGWYMYVAKWREPMWRVNRFVDVNDDFIADRALTDWLARMALVGSLALQYGDAHQLRIYIDTYVGTCGKWKCFTDSTCAVYVEKWKRKHTDGRSFAGWMDGWLDQSIEGEVVVVVQNKGALVGRKGSRRLVLDWKLLQTVAFGRFSVRDIFPIYVLNPETQSLLVSSFQNCR